MDTQARTRLQTGEEAENASAMAFSANHKFEPARILSYPRKNTTRKWKSDLLGARLREVRYLSAAMYDALDALDIERATGIIQGIRYLVIEAQQLLEKELS